MSSNSVQKGNSEPEAEVGKDSLKVKIKLNKNNINNKTDSSMEEITPLTDQLITEKPLKIKIRKNDLISSSPSVNNTTEPSNAKVLGLAVFPKLDPVSFPQLQRVSSVTPEQFSDWSDRDINLLKDELENIKRNIKDFTTSLQSQLDILETAKDKKEALICKPPPVAPSTPLSISANHLSNSTSNTLASPISTSVASPIIKKDPLPVPTPPSQVKAEPKRRYRKRKKHEGSSDEDEQFEEREESEIEDEIDVVNDVDVEDAEYIDAPLDNENKSGP